MIRRWGTVGIVLLLLAGVPEAWGQLQRSRSLNTRIVVCTTTESHVASARTDRVTLTLFNAGTVHVNVGLSNAGGFQGMTLHAGASIEFQNFEGGINCRMGSGAGTTAIEVLEEFKGPS